MFTWNFQYISRSRLGETVETLALGGYTGDILVRIHTAIHSGDEAVELAAKMKELIPAAHILGTSTSAAVCGGKIMRNQCVISVSVMEGGSIYTAMLPAAEGDPPLPADGLCKALKNSIIKSDTKLMLTFFTGSYTDIGGFTEHFNRSFPSVQMTGGLAVGQGKTPAERVKNGFVFDENGWSDSSVIAAAIGGDEFESCCSCASGVQAVGEEMRITGVSGSRILTLDGEEAAKKLCALTENGEQLVKQFPFVCPDEPEIPVFLSIERENDAENGEKHVVIASGQHAVRDRRLRRAFVYDKRMISDNTALFRRTENFDKAQTVFGYLCASRFSVYPNIVKWELSVYEDSNICGCMTGGVLTYKNGRNIFADCIFAVTAAGEEKAIQKYHPYTLLHTGPLAEDNRKLLGYLLGIRRVIANDPGAELSDGIHSFISECGRLLLCSGDTSLPGGAAMNMDISLRGYDRICMINVFDTSSIDTVFPEELIQLTYRNYISKIIRFAQDRHYTAYLIDKWQVAVGAPSYMVRLSEFSDDMRFLQKQLFDASGIYIAIVPMLCVIDGCTAENIENAYNSARLDMTKRNVQFCVCDARVKQLDEESIREHYHIVNVINYAIANDRVIPYYQGIHDNKLGFIHHYEALMRLEDEDGKIYYPASFLGVARSYRLLYDSITLKMLGKVFDRFKDSEDDSVSVNLGIRDIDNGLIVEFILARLGEMRHPENFVFEILENEEVEDYSAMIMFVEMIHSLGAKISIDDFGSGYSNLKHVANINCDYLKIDGSIVKNCRTDEQCANLIELIAGWKFLSGGKFRVIAEYVESRGIQDMIISNRIDFSQGYLFAKPVPDIVLRSEMTVPTDMRER